MRVLIAVIIIALLVGGFYLGWFRFSSSETGGTSNVTLSVDKDKMEADKDKAVEEARELKDKAKERISGDGTGASSSTEGVVIEKETTTVIRRPDGTIVEEKTVEVK